jgi:hypothetical protein
LKIPTESIEQQPDADAWLDQFSPDELLEIVTPAETAPVDRSARPISALQQWRSELRSGYRGQRLDRPSTWRSDALFTAACWEAAGIEAERTGLPATASMYFARSATTILDAAKEKSA